MILDILIVCGLFVYFLVSYLSYRKMETLVMNHNFLILYHIYFLQAKYRDYGEPLEDIQKKTPLEN